MDDKAAPLDTNALTAGTPVLDFDVYRPLVAAQYDNPEAADAFLRSLWFIMCAFVDLGMNVKSSTDNLPFMRELASEFEASAPELENTEKQNDDRAKLEAAQEGDA